MGRIVEVKLSKWQTQVLDDPHRFKVVNVGRRSGKTVLAVIDMLILASQKKVTIWYIAPTYRQAKQIAWQLLKEYCPPAFKAVFNESELKCILPNGSLIELKGADNPDSLRGTKVDHFKFDEVAFFPEWRRTWDALRPILVDSKAGAWFISTPNGFNWFYELYLTEHTDDDYKSFHFTSYDNPYIATEEIDKAKEEMDERSFAQEFLADFNKPQGTVYAEWDISHYQAAPYDPNLPLHISFDWGVSDPTSVVFIQPQGGEVRIIDYYEASDANIEHFISVIRAKPYKPADLYTGDPSGKARTLTTGTSVIELLARKGIHVRVKDGVKIPEQIRVAHSFMTRLYINSESPGTVIFKDCLLNYRYPTKKETAVNQENENPIHDQYSHAMRAFEYWCVNYGDIPHGGTKAVAYAGGDMVTGYGRSISLDNPIEIHKGYTPKKNVVIFKRWRTGASLHCRDHVEEMIVERLNRRFPDDEFVSDTEYQLLVQRLDVVFARILEEVHIPSFTNEDLLSFMCMKAHQLMRRDAFNAEKGKITTLAYTSFKNLCRDIIKMQNSAWRRNLETDPLDHTWGSQDWSRAPLNTISYEILVEYDQLQSQSASV